jgi:hypothetical protein
MLYPIISDDRYGDKLSGIKREMKKMDLCDLNGVKGLLVREEVAYVWYGGHTVNLYNIYTEKNFDMYSIGDFTTDNVSYDEFERSVEEHIKNGI